MRTATISRGAVLAGALGVAGALHADSPLNALKLDVLCRGGHTAEKLEAHRQWCAGYARGIREALSATGGLAPGCVPADDQMLWDRFGAWLVFAHPDERHRSATQAVLLALRSSC